MQTFENTIETLASMSKESMTIHKGREVRIYRTSNPQLVDRFMVLGGKVEDPYFEVVEFGYDFKNSNQLSEYFIKFPGVDLYIELMNQGGSEHGQFKKKRLRNPVQEQIRPLVIDGELIPETLDLYLTHDAALLSEKIGTDFLFLKSVAYKKDQGGRYNFQAEDVEFGERYVNQMLNSHFVKLPDLRGISYAYKTSIGEYLIVDHSAFNYTYEGLRCWFGKPGEMVQVKIENFGRMRDGGTTMFEFEHEGKKHKFFSPSGLSMTTKVTTLDDVSMYQPIETDLANRVKELGINLQPKTRK